MAGEIDLVVPYVDSSDVAWQELFNKYNPIKDEEVEAVNAKNRFRGQGDFFRFFFRGVEKYAPWVHKIHLIVQSESQVPAWINRDVVHIVLHEQFIPKEFLPTFNSTTIEMFLWNIPGLSEKFIYANDDVFITGPILKGYLFQDYRVVTNIFNVTRLNTIYYKQVDNSYKEIYNYLQDEVVTIGHTLRPYFKSDMHECFKIHKDNILKSISAFREPKNFNVYLFTFDLKRKDKIVPGESIKCLTSNKIKTIISAAEKSSKTTICIQDIDGDANIYEDKTLFEVFKNKFPKKSKYEDPDVIGGITDEQLKYIDTVVNKVPESMQEALKQKLLKSLSI